MVQIKHNDLSKSCSTSNVHTGGITTPTDAGNKREGDSPLKRSARINRAQEF